MNNEIKVDASFTIMPLVEDLISYVADTRDLVTLSANLHRELRLGASITSNSPYYTDLTRLLNTLIQKEGKLLDKAGKQGSYQKVKGK